jgi:hypothetical protein
MTDKKIRELIEAIDRFHGNALKDREDSHIQREVSVIKSYLKGLTQEYSYNDGLDGQEEIIEELTND